MDPDDHLRRRFHRLADWYDVQADERAAAAARATPRNAPSRNGSRRVLVPLGAALAVVAGVSGAVLALTGGERDPSPIMVSPQYTSATATPTTDGDATQSVSPLPTSVPTTHGSPPAPSTPNGTPRPSAPRPSASPTGTAGPTTSPGAQSPAPQLSGPQSSGQRSPAAQAAGGTGPAATADSTAAGGRDAANGSTGGAGSAGGAGQGAGAALAPPAAAPMPVTLANADFEQTSLLDLNRLLGGPPPGWTGSSGIFAAGWPRYPAGTVAGTEGRMVMTIAGTARPARQATRVSVREGVTYTLTVALGNRSSSDRLGAPRLAITADGSPVAVLDVVAPGPAGQFSDVTLTWRGTAAATGRTLGVEIDNLDDSLLSYVDVDHVRLTSR